MKMVKVKYYPEQGTPDETETLGHKFNAKKPTDVTNEAVLETLRGNPFFEVLDKEPVKAKEPELVAVEQDDGAFAILHGKEVVKSDLSKEDADAFNALSDADKAEYVK